MSVVFIVCSPDLHQDCIYHTAFSVALLTIA